MDVTTKISRFGCKLALVAMLLHANAVADDSAAEVSVKAAIAHKIAKFVSWPDARFAAGDEPLRFCVLGDQKILEAFETLYDRPIHGRPLQVLAAPDPEFAADSCDVLYLAQDDKHSAGTWLSSVAGQPVLTFGEAGEYGGDGSIVVMMIRRNKVRFSINLKANEDTGLRISAQLLQLAATVGSSGS